MLTKPNEEFDYFSDKITRLRRVRVSETLSSNPARELAIVCVVMILAFSAFICLMMRFGKMGGDVFMLFLTFILSLVYHLRESVVSALLIIDEMIFEFYVWQGVLPFTRERHLRSFKAVEAVTSFCAFMALFVGTVYPCEMFLNIALTALGLPPNATATSFTGGG